MRFLGLGWVVKQEFLISIVCFKVFGLSDCSISDTILIYQFNLFIDFLCFNYLTCQPRSALQV